MVSDIFNALFGWAPTGWLAVVGLLPVFFTILLKSPLGKLHLASHEAERKRHVGRLIQNKPKERYERFIKPVLDGLDNRLTPEATEGLSEAQIAWSPRLFQVLAMAAIGYPVLSSIIQWLCGFPITFGTVEVLAAGTGTERAKVGIILGLVVVLVTFGAVSKSWLRQTLFVLAAMILFAAAELSERLGIPPDVAVAVAVAVAGAVAIAVAGAVAGAVALWASRRAESAQNSSSLVALYIVCLLVSAVATVLSPPQEPLAQQAFALVMLGFLPLMNTLADFASVGLTRYLLRKGLTRNGPWRALQDLVYGAAIFALLGCGAITYFHFVTFSDGTPIFDMQTLFDGLATSPGDYAWLGFMLLTTLIPTLLHGVIGLGSMGLQQPEWVRARLVRALSSDVETDRWQGTLAYCALWAFAGWIVVALSYLIWTLDKGIVIDGLITAFRAYAVLIGAVTP